MSQAASSDRVGMVAVVSAKGGCGATFVAAHLAVAVSMEGLRSVLLADLDASRGDVARVLDLEERNGFQPLADFLDAWDDELLHHAIPMHRTGVRALLQPYELASILRLDPGEAERLILGLRDRWSLVVADCGTQLEAHTLPALLAADRIVVVLHGTVPAVRNTQRLLGLLDRLQIPAERVFLVLNAHSGRDLPEAEVERLLEHFVAAVLPEEPACRDADTHGDLLFDLAPRAPCTQALLGLSSVLGLTRAIEPGGRGGGWRMALPWSRR